MKTRYIQLTSEGLFQNELIPGLHAITEDAIEVEDLVFMVLSQNPQSKKYNLETDTVSDYVAPPPPFILADEKAMKTQEINDVIGLKIISGFTSSALGSEHRYQSELEDQVNLSGLAANGKDREFKCSADNGVTWSQVFHTAEQLNQVASDGIDFKESHLKTAATLKYQVESLPDTATQADLDAIVIP